MGILDIFIGPLYLMIILAAGSSLSNRLYAGDEEMKQYYMYGLGMKIFSGFCFVMIYTFYYPGGDTDCYFSWASSWPTFLSRYPDQAIQWLIYNDKDSYYTFYFMPEILKKVGGKFHVFKYGTPELFFIRTLVVPTLLGMNTILATTFIYASISFWSSWQLFKVFIDIKPEMKRELAIACIFVPSALFWGSGVMKDTLTFSSLCWLTAALYWGVLKQKNLLVNIGIVILCSYLIIMLKPYVILAFMPAASYWIFMTYNSKIKNPTLRRLSAPILLVFAGAAVGYGFSKLGSSMGKYSVDNLQKTAEDFQTWHATASEHGSGYTLGGEGDFSTFGLLKKFPLAVNVTFFRPYLWETRNIVTLITAVESLIMFYLFVRLLIKTKISKLPSVIGSHPAIVFCLIFSLIFSFAVGLTSYNFGALARYKIPCLPFFALFLFMSTNEIDKRLRGEDENDEEEEEEEYEEYEEYQENLT